MDKDVLDAEGTQSQPEDIQDGRDEENKQRDPKDMTIDESSKAARKFYWGLIHNNKRINPVPIVLNVSYKAEWKSKRLHRTLKNTISSSPDNVTQQEKANQEQHLSVMTSQLTESITAISLLMDNANRAKKKIISQNQEGKKNWIGTSYLNYPRR